MLPLQNLQTYSSTLHREKNDLDRGYLMASPGSAKGKGGEKGANIDEEAMSVGFLQPSFYAHCFQSGLFLGHDSAHKHWH
jgi:hypothetical protein